MQNIADFSSKSLSSQILMSLVDFCELMILPYPKPVIVLTIMYLLIRISVSFPKGEWERGL